MTFIPNITGLVSTTNSTTTPLGVSATFTGTAEIVSQYATVTVICFSDKDSAPTGLQIQFSSDGTNWDIVKSITYLTPVKFSLSILITNKYLRVVYLNSASAQGTFRLQTLYHISKIPVDTSQSVYFPSQLVDSFGRLRVSDPHTLLDITYTEDINSYFETQLISGTGAITKLANAPMVNMTVTAGTGSAIKQSRQRGIYEPGKSLLIYMTGILNSGGANGTGVTTRLGYFDADNGEFFSHVGNGTTGTIFVNERSSCTGSIVTTSVAQSAWNIDKMDGTGPSGLNIDPSKALIYVIDLEWLGSGLVRFGIDISGKTYYCHFYYHSNYTVLPYTQVGSLPLRSEIVTTSGAGTLSRICGTVISEGGFAPTGRIFSYTRPITSLVTISTTPLPIVSFQLKTTGVFPKVNVYPSAISVINTANQNCTWYLVMFRDLATASVLTGSVFTSINPNSSVNYDISASALALTFPDYTNANIIIISTGLLSSTSDTLNIPLPSQGNNPAMLTTNLANQGDILCLIATASGNTAMTASMTLCELY